MRRDASIIGAGCNSRGDGRVSDSTRRIVCQFDNETFEAIRTRAMQDGTSFAHQVRLLVEWGLEAA